jgi:hypothetical protein
MDGLEKLEFAGWSGHITSCSDLKSMLLAQNYVDAGPESMFCAAEYLWMPGEANLSDLRGSGWLRQVVTCESEKSWCAPEQSDLIRPIVISYGDRREDGLELWDGVHRTHSAAILGKTTLPAAIGLRLTIPDRHDIEMSDWVATPLQRLLGAEGTFKLIRQQAEDLLKNSVSLEHFQNHYDDRFYFTQDCYEKILEIAEDTRNVLAELLPTPASVERQSKRRGPT